MATIKNRSPVIVTVPGHPELRREFSSSRTDDAKNYMRELVAGVHATGQPVQPRIVKGDTSPEVYIKDSGCTPICIALQNTHEASDVVERTLDKCKQRGLNSHNRDRRLRDDEETLLVAHARREDTRIAVEDHIEVLLRLEFGETAFSSLNAREKRLLVHRKELRSTAESHVEHQRNQGRSPTPWVETLLQLQLMTAARRSEVIGLLWEHIDFGERTVFLQGVCISHSRTLPLRTELTELLSRLPRLNEQVFQFGRLRLDKLWRRLLNATGISDLHIRDLRHECICRLAETEGVNLFDLAAFSGHHLTIAQRYMHLCSKRVDHKRD